MNGLPVPNPAGRDLEGGIPMREISKQACAILMNARGACGHNVQSHAERESRIDFVEARQTRENAWSMLLALGANGQIAQKHAEAESLQGEDPQNLHLSTSAATPKNAGCHHRYSMGQTIYHIQHKDLLNL